MTKKLTEYFIFSILYVFTHIQPLLQIVELNLIQSMKILTLCYCTTTCDGTHMKHFMLPIDYSDLVATLFLQRALLYMLTDGVLHLLVHQCKFVTSFQFKFYIYLFIPLWIHTISLAAIIYCVGL